VLSDFVQGVLMRSLVRDHGERRLLIQGAATLALGLVALPFVGVFPYGALPLLLLAMAFVAYGAGVVSPSLSSLISQSAGKTVQGGVLGISQSAASLARILGPAFAGAVFALAGRNAPYVAGTAVMLVVMVLAQSLAQRHGARPRQPDPPA
jgi:MFS family permease